MKLVDWQEAERAVKDGVLELAAGQVLSAAARKNLQRRRVTIRRQTLAPQGAKPEAMTHLDGKTLVKKSHPRIRFRGKMDSLQAEVVLTQCMLGEKGGNGRIIDDLQGILDLLRQVTRAEALDEVITNWTILGMKADELRERSHNTKKYYGVEYMALPDWKMGEAYSRLNRLRALAREVETLAAQGFGDFPTAGQKEIQVILNRLSSGFHIMMCRILAGEYD